MCLAAPGVEQAAGTCGDCVLHLLYDGAPDPGHALDGALDADGVDGEDVADFGGGKIRMLHQLFESLMRKR